MVELYSASTDVLCTILYTFLNSCFLNLLPLLLDNPPFVSPNHIPIWRTSKNLDRNSQAFWLEQNNDHHEQWLRKQISSCEILCNGGGCRNTGDVKVDCSCTIEFYTHNKELLFFFIFSWRSPSNSCLVRLIWRISYRHFQNPYQECFCCFPSKIDCRETTHFAKNDN